jgi:hypothetical protein
MEAHKTLSEALAVEKILGERLKGERALLSRSFLYARQLLKARQLTAQIKAQGAQISGVTEERALFTLNRHRLLIGRLGERNWRYRAQRAHTQNEDQQVDSQRALLSLT